jgi:metal-responsive CopG/Arc/MetJ family transcriptional regulator
MPVIAAAGPPARRLPRLHRLLGARSKKTKTSISIAANLLAAADELAGKSGRSEFVERAVRASVRRWLKRARHERELVLLNAQADRLNAEAAETLAFQPELEDE